MSDGYADGKRQSSCIPSLNGSDSSKLGALKPDQAEHDRDDVKDDDISAQRKRAIEAIYATKSFDELISVVMAQTLPERWVLDAAFQRAKSLAGQDR